MKEPVPVHLLLGMLGSGKTTTLQSLIREKPVDETWAIVINEYGPVSIDTSLVSEGGMDSSIGVTELASGCICCSARIDLMDAIPEVLRSLEPDRIFIEPTGLAMPEQLIADMKAVEESLRIQLFNTIVHFDLAKFKRGAHLSMPFWKGLIAVSDFIIATKIELAKDQVLSAFEEMTVPAGCLKLSKRENLFALICQRKRSEKEIEPVLSFSPFGGMKESLVFPQNAASEEVIQQDLANEKGKFYLQKGNEKLSYGWEIAPCFFILKQDIEFWLSSLELKNVKVLRAKGVIKCHNEWLVFQYVEGQPLDWKSTFERKLSQFACITEGDPIESETFEELWRK